MHQQKVSLRVYILCHRPNCEIVPVVSLQCLAREFSQNTKSATNPISLKNIKRLEEFQTSSWNLTRVVSTMPNRCEKREARQGTGDERRGAEKGKRIYAHGFQAVTLKVMQTCTLYIHIERKTTLTIADSMGLHRYLHN